MTERFYLEYKDLTSEELERMLEKRLDKLSALYGKLREAISKDSLEEYWRVNEETRIVRCQIGAIQIIRNQRGLD